MICRPAARPAASPTTSASRGFVRAVLGRVVLLCSALLLAGLVLAPGGFARAEPAASVFEVRRLAVDRTAADPLAARDEALGAGRIDALGLLLRRLTRRADWQRLPAVTRGMAERAVRDFSIADERTSDVRYLAALTVRFDPEVVRGILRGAGVPFAETASRRVLVLPVLQDESGFMLWGEGNGWFDAWARLPARDGLLPMVVPVGDLEDIVSVSAEQAIAGDSAPLAALAARYDASDTFVAVAAPATEPVSGRPSLTVSLARIGPTAERRAPSLRTFTAAPGQSLAALFAQAARETADGAEDAWIEANLLRFDNAQTLDVVAPLASLADWVAIRDRLAQVAQITTTSLRALGREAAELRLAYLGTERQLREALAQTGLVMDAPQGALVGRPLPVIRLADARR